MLEWRSKHAQPQSEDHAAVMSTYLSSLDYSIGLVLTALLIVRDMSLEVGLEFAWEVVSWNGLILGFLLFTHFLATHI